MKKLIAGAAVGALALGVVPIRAQAAPPAPTVEGQGVFQTLGIPNTNTMTITWNCNAAATPGLSAVPIGVIVDCTLRVGGSVVDRAYRASLAPATATEPRVTVAIYGNVELCWEAIASYTDGVLRRDETGPNCEVGESILDHFFPPPE